MHTKDVYLNFEEIVGFMMKAVLYTWHATLCLVERFEHGITILTSYWCSKFVYLERICICNILFSPYVPVYFVVSHILVSVSYGIGAIHMIVKGVAFVFHLIFGP